MVVELLVYGWIIRLQVDVYVMIHTFNSLWTLACDRELFTMLRTVGAYWAYSLNIHRGSGSIRKDFVFRSFISAITSDVVTRGKESRLDKAQ